MAMWKLHGPLGDHLVLKFVNTVDDDGKTRDDETLLDGEAVLDWALSVGVLREAEAGSALVEALAAERGDLLRLREAIWRVLSGGPQAPSAAHQQVTDAVCAALAAAGPRPGSPHFWAIDAAALGAAGLRHRLALAFLDLTLSPDLARLRECGRCTALYLDRGRGAGRRWCRMKTCGNREKVARYRGRRASSAEP